MKVKSMSWTRPEIIVNKFNPQPWGGRYILVLVYKGAWEEVGTDAEEQKFEQVAVCLRRRLNEGDPEIETSSSTTYPSRRISDILRILRSGRKFFYCCLKFCISLLPSQIITIVHC